MQSVEVFLGFDRQSIFNKQISIIYALVPWCIPQARIRNADFVFQQNEVKSLRDGSSQRTRRVSDSHLGESTGRSELGHSQTSLSTLEIRLLDSGVAHQEDPPTCGFQYTRWLSTQSRLPSLRLFDIPPLVNHGTKGFDPSRS